MKRCRTVFILGGLVLALARCAHDAPSNIQTVNYQTPNSATATPSTTRKPMQTMSIKTPQNAEFGSPTGTVSGSGAQP